MDKIRKLKLSLILLQATSLLPQFNTLSKEGNARQELQTPIKSTDNWNDYHDTIMRVYEDKHVVIYYDAQVNENNQSITWPFALITKAWRYTKDAYPYFEADSLLYVIIHKQTHNSFNNTCNSATYLEVTYDSRNTIDCGEWGPLTATPQHSNFFYRLVTSFGHLVRRAANRLVNDADKDVAAMMLQEIISWDVFNNVTDPSGRLQEWKTEKVETAYKDVFWFQDWFLPIYEQFRGSSVINKYFNLTYTHLPRARTNFDVSLNAGEVIHFWSGAAGADLFQVVAINAFRRKSLLYQDELIQARKSYPNFNYTVKDCDKNQFECGNGLCIQSFRRCNGIVECRDAFDEANCTDCASTAFKCEVGGCVPGSARCDFKYDCPEDSDEMNCAELYPLWLTVSLPLPHLGTDNGPRSNLSRSYVDDHLVVYTDKDLSTSQNNYSILSEAWEHVEKTYDFIRRRFPLVVILNGNPNTTHTDCLSFSNTYMHEAKRFTPRYLIQCGHLQLKEWDHSTSDTHDTDAQKMLHSLVSLVWFNEYGLGNNADSDVCGFEFLNILTYDVIKHVHSESKITLNWKNSFLSRLSKGRHCFRDWYLPIYESHGGSSALLRFYNVMNNRGHYSSKYKYYGLVKMGQFVHVWSGAVQVDLQELASYAFGWSREYMDELHEARKSYNRLNYTLNEYQVTYADSDVAIYAKHTMYHNVSYAILSEAWKYVKAKYVTFSNGPFNLQLQVSAGTQNITAVRAVCPLVSKNKLFKRPPNFLNIIDCSPPVVEESTGASATFLDLTLAQMGELALKYSHVTHSDWPASQVSGTTLNSILVYDIYISLNETKYAGGWILKQNNQTMSFPRDRTFWFRDWYYKIYDTYGKSAVLNKFISLVNSFKDNATTSRQINMGEFVHTWSGAARINLKKLAQSAFGWNQTYEAQFTQAKLGRLGYCDNPNCDGEGQESSSVKEGSGNVLTTTGVAISIFLLVVALICFGGKIALDRKKIRTMSLRIRHLTNEEVNEFLNGNLNLNNTDAHRPIHSLPFISKYEISPARLVINDSVILGAGEFGVVKEGKLLADQYSSSSDLTVAVKMVKPDVEVGYFKAFLAEIKIMAFLGHHENIASLLGTVTGNIRNCEVFVAMEYCSKGDLLHFVQANCDNFQDIFRPKFENASQVLFMSRKSGEPENVVKFEKSRFDSEKASQSVSVAVVSYENSPISTLDLLEWSRQISEGMSYLTIKNVIHGDVAARNVLLTGNNNAKICDFGLSRELINYSRYLKESVTPLPWAWLAIECLNDKIFSVQSDIWAFGVTLWEIFTLGKVPHSGRTWDRAFVNELTSGMRLTTPQYGNREIYNLMINCMMHLPSERISFSEINLELKRIKGNLVSNPITPTTANPTSAYVALN